MFAPSQVKPIYRPESGCPSSLPATGLSDVFLSGRLKLRNNRLPSRTVSVSGPAYPSNGELTSILPYPAIQASTHCHQSPSIPPATRGYFWGTLMSLFNESGNSHG